MKTTNKGSKGLFHYDAEWCKHLRPAFKRIFWKTERSKQKEFIIKEIKEKNENNENNG